MRNWGMIGAVIAVIGIIVAILIGIGIIRPTDSKNSIKITAIELNAFNSLAKLNTDDAYTLFSEIENDFSKNSKAKKANLLKIVISASEVAAHYVIIEKYVIDNYKKFNSKGNIKSINLLFENSKKQLIKWNKRLIKETENLISLTEDNLYLKIEGKPDRWEIKNSGSQFALTQEKLIAGDLPSDAEIDQFKRFMRYRLIGATIRNLLNIKIDTYKTSIESLEKDFIIFRYWVDGKLYGKVNWVGVIKTVIASFTVSAPMINIVNKEDETPFLNCERVTELANRGLELLKDDEKEDKNLLKKSSDLCFERLETSSIFNKYLN
ncbi:MAG: hypothetical protein GY797_22945 [Deltaproteobacteria bacterium]|nr:hypothetical protein [Deltaproteobacteria bacterium]